MPHDPMQSAGPRNRTGTRNDQQTAANRHPDSTPSLFDAVGEPREHAAIGGDEGQRRKEAGMAEARYGEAIGIVSAIEADVRRRARSRETFLPDDVLPNLASRRALGPVFSRLRREGVIEIVGTAISTRPERHGALTRVYRGVGGGA